MNGEEKSRGQLANEDKTNILTLWFILLSHINDNANLYRLLS